MNCSNTTKLETISVIVPEFAVEPFERAMALACITIGLFEVEGARTFWCIEGVKQVNAQEQELDIGLTLARAVTGLDIPIERSLISATGWLERTRKAFPEQLIGNMFSIHGTHMANFTHARRRVELVIDAGLAFGSGEHVSTRGCLQALEHISRLRPKPSKVMDMGCGSAILAMAAAKLLHSPTFAIDIDPCSVRTARANVRFNQLSRHVRVDVGNGCHSPLARKNKPYDLIFANILARPLCRMAKKLATMLNPGGITILAGVLTSQVNMVNAAYRRNGLVLYRSLKEAGWSTLIMKKP